MDEQSDTPRKLKTRAGELDSWPDEVHKFSHGHERPVEKPRQGARSLRFIILRIMLNTEQNRGVPDPDQCRKLSSKCCAVLTFDVSTV
eukprot:scaffold27667_cov102-Isochrysis_galbana.AAC.2